MKRKKPDHISQQDWDEADIPELTAADFANARPFAEVFPEIAAAMKRKPGRPKKDEPKVHMGFRFARDVANGIKAVGKGANARVEQVLRDAIQAGKL